jgi:hypothetical protein
MRSNMGTLPSLPLAMAALAIGATAEVSWAQDGNEIPFPVADVLAELNNTDGDLGFHALIDGEAWKLLEIRGPDGRRILLLRPRSALAQQGLTQLFFESAEPPFDVLTPEEFFERFPEGEYQISGRTIERVELESTDEFTHLLAAPDPGFGAGGCPRNVLFPSGPPSWPSRLGSS